MGHAFFLRKAVAWAPGAEDKTDENQGLLRASVPSTYAANSRHVGAHECGLLSRGARFRDRSDKGRRMLLKPRARLLRRLKLGDLDAIDRGIALFGAPQFQLVHLGEGNGAIQGFWYEF
jgi:hypothetical protein